MCNGLQALKLASEIGFPVVRKDGRAYGHVTTKIKHKHCFQFLLILSVIAKKNEKQISSKFWGAKVHYGRCASGEWIDK